MVNPAPYPTTDHAESRAINIFEELVSDKHIKVHINIRDKVPNHDGHIELVNDENEPTGRIDVQIKKLPNGFDPSNPKINIPLSLYAYSKKTGNPTFYLGVDVSNQKTYWIHVHGDLQNSSNVTLAEIRDDQQSTTILLKLDDINDGFINEHDKNFLSRWREIIEEYLERVHKYIELMEAHEELKKFADPSLGAQDDDFIYIHLFLDEINNLLSSFEVVKHRLYSPQTWKLGFMYREFSDTNMIYTLYPINYDVNDIQIKKIDDLRKEGLGITIHMGNPIRHNYQKYAWGLIKSDINQILGNRSLYIKNKFLANELTYAFVNRFYQQLGLEKKDEYTVKEIYKTLGDVDIIKGKKDLPFYIFNECVVFLRDLRISKIKRIYKAKDYSRNRDSSWIWNTLSPENVMENLDIFFNNLYNVYNDVTDQNFPSIKNELNYFSDVSKLIVVTRLREKYQTYEDMPKIGLYYLTGESKDLSIDLYQEDDQSIPTIIRNHFVEREMPRDRGIQIDGNHFEFKFISDRILDFIYDDTPMFSYIYYQIERNLERYFKNNYND